MTEIFGLRRFHQKWPCFRFLMFPHHYHPFSQYWMNNSSGLIVPNSFCGLNISSGDCKAYLVKINESLEVPPARARPAHAIWCDLVLPTLDHPKHFGSETVFWGSIVAQHVFSYEVFAWCHRSFEAYRPGWFPTTDWICNVCFLFSLIPDWFHPVFFWKDWTPCRHSGSNKFRRQCVLLNAHKNLGM